MISYHEHYDEYLHMIQRRNKIQKVSDQKTIENGSAMEIFQARRMLDKRNEEETKVPTGIAAMARCRKGLEALDTMGWQRSWHQREFHDNFLAACARVFYKEEPAGKFEREFQTILDVNGWDRLFQEILISTPRRFGKTVSVSMFAASLLYSCPSVEISIYSTGKRISQKMLRNIIKFLGLIYQKTGETPMKTIRDNSEEIFLQGGLCSHDVRIANSYPSRVCFPSPSSVTEYR